MEGDVSVSALPWRWVIESLARSQEVNVALFSGLLLNAPPLLGKLGKEAMEVTALRCLEGMVCSRDGSRDDHLESSLSISRFDSAESCENVLQRVLHETAGLNLLEDASDELKSDVRFFISKKKTSLPRSTLELLKNDFVEGPHPLAASLKEICGYQLRNQCVQSMLSGGGNLASPSLRVDENGCGSQAVLEEGHNDSPKLGIGDEPVQANLPNGNFLHCKRDSSHICVENYLKESDGASRDREHHVTPGKKLKLDKQFAVWSEQQVSAPSGVSSRSSDAVAEQNHQLSKANGSPAKIYLNKTDQTPILLDNDETFSGKIDLQKKPSLLSPNNAEAEQCRSSRSNDAKAEHKSNWADDADAEQCNSSRSNNAEAEQYRSSRSNGAEAEQCRSSRSSGAEAEQNLQVSKANRTHDGKSGRVNLGKTAKNFVINPDQTLHSSDNQVPSTSKIDLHKKLAFLGSQCALSEDPFTMADTEANLCMKCNSDGQLLICNANTCPLAFHESCLGYSASFDDQGNFYCPFCAYSRAISEYVKAKEKASLARRELSLFIGGRSINQPDHDSELALENNASLQGPNKDKTAEPQNGVNVVNQDANNCQFRSSKDNDEDLSAPSAPTPPNASATAAPVISSEDRQGAETIIQLGKGVSGMQNQQLGDPGSGGCKLSHGNEKITNASREGAKVASEPRGDEKAAGHKVSEPHGDEKITSAREKGPEVERKEKAARNRVFELRGEASSESISDSEAHSEAGNSKCTSRVLSPTPLRAISGNYQSRRKKVPWTAEEEAMLKKGIDEFVKGDDRAVPWKYILEYGGSVFQKGRTAVDLKDKWRNIMRAKAPK